MSDLETELLDDHPDNSDSNSECKCFIVAASIGLFFFYISAILILISNICFIKKVDDMFLTMIGSEEREDAIFLIWTISSLIFLINVVAIWVIIVYYKPQSICERCFIAMIPDLMAIAFFLFIISFVFLCIGFSYVSPSKHDSYYKNAMEVIKNYYKKPKANQWFFDQLGLSDKEANESVIGEFLVQMIKSNCEQCNRYQLRLYAIIFYVSPTVTIFFSCFYNCCCSSDSSQTTEESQHIEFNASPKSDDHTKSDNFISHSRKNKNVNKTKNRRKTKKGKKIKRSKNKMKYEKISDEDSSSYDGLYNFF